MKKSIKITESQYKTLLLSEQGDVKFDMQQEQRDGESPKKKPKKEFKMDYNKLKNNPTPEYIATVLKNSEGFFGDNEAWAQAAFEVIKDRKVYNEVSSLLGDYAYNFVKGFMDTDKEYHTKGKTIDSEFRRISPPTYHDKCNNGMGVKSKPTKLGGSITIPNHSENCVSCDPKISQYCKSRGEISTIVTEKGSYWDDYFGLKGDNELPAYDGHWDSELYSYCICRGGEAKTLNTTNNGSAVFFIEEGPSIKQGYDVSPKELENRRKIFFSHRKKEKEYNIDNSSIYEAFDCSKFIEKGKDWRYTQCVTDNISMAVSIVPGPGTAISAILDFANGISYLSHALFAVKDPADSEDSVGNDLFMAAISFASVIPGYGEARSIFKLTTPKTTKAASNIITDLKNMGGLKNIDSIDKVVFKHTKDLTKKDKNNVGKVINNLKNIDVSSLETQAQIFGDIVKSYEKKGIERHTINQLMKNPKFIKILKNNGNDLIKTLKSEKIKTMLFNMGVQFGFGIGLSKYQTLKKKNEKEKEIFLKLLTDKGYSQEEQKEIKTKISNTVSSINLPGLKKEVSEILTQSSLYEKTIDVVKSSDDKVPVSEVKSELDNETNYIMNLTEEDVKELLQSQLGDSSTTKNENIMKIKKVRITETQYKRLFSEETENTEQPMEVIKETSADKLQACKDNQKMKDLKSLLGSQYSDYSTEIRYDSDNDGCMVRLHKNDYYRYFFTDISNKLVIISPDIVRKGYDTNWTKTSNSIRISPLVLDYQTDKRTKIGNFTYLDDLIKYYENIVDNSSLTDSDIENFVSGVANIFSNGDDADIVELKMNTWDKLNSLNKCKFLKKYNEDYPNNKYWSTLGSFTLNDPGHFKARSDMKKEWEKLKNNQKDYCCVDWGVC